MSWLIGIGHYLWIVFGNVWGFLLLIAGALDLGERFLDRKTIIPAWVRISVLVGVVFVAQGVAYKDLLSNPPTVLRIPVPPAPVIQFTGPLKVVAKAKPEQNQSGHDNVQSGPITQAPCSALQQGGSGNQANVTCEPPPLKLAWSVEDTQPIDGFSNNLMLSVKSNVDFHPVSFIIVCDQDIKAVNAYGTFFGNKSWGITRESNRVGYVYFDNPSLAPGVPLQVVVSSDKPFKILSVQQHEIKLNP